MKSTPLFAAALLALSACSSTGTSTTPQPVAATPKAAFTHAIEGRETAKGSFIGTTKHTTTGHASVFRSNGQWFVSLASDFSFSGAPSPKVAFGANGYRPDAVIAPLSSNNGASVYAVPASLDVGDFNEIWIWCDQVGIPLGLAELSLT